MYKVYLEEIHDNILKDLKIALSSEQLKAVVVDAPTVLLSARAGSGKTRVSTIKAYYLIKYKNVKINEIKMLAFNKKAALELKERLSGYGFNDCKIPSTFHSLAFNIVKKKINITKKDILTDEEDREDLNRLKYIENILKEVLNEDNSIKEDIYNLFKDEMKDIEDDLSREEFIDRRKESNKYTLGLEIVKNYGEKYIGDFLFEHELIEPNRFWYKHLKPYKYRRSFYRPAYTLSHKPTESGYVNTVIDYFDIDDREYCKEYNDIQQKRRFWETGYNEKREKNKNKVNFIEMNRLDILEGREKFVELLEERLTKLGIKIRKLTEEEIYNKIEKSHISKLAKMIASFISKSLKKNLTPLDINLKLRKNKHYSESMCSYLKIANKVYATYLEKLKYDKKKDFDLLLKDAKNIVRETQGNILGLQDIKLLIIDEYQDFSPLFYELIEEIRVHNNNLKLFCVGDDWQAINSYAGSDLNFFLSFDKYFPGSVKLNLLTNYRSSKKIIDESNSFMEWTDGKGAIAFNKCVEKEIYLCEENKNIEYVFLEGYDAPYEVLCENDYELEELKKFCKLKSNNFDYLEREKETQILEKIASILMLKETSRKDILILSKTNNISGKLTLIKLRNWINLFISKYKLSHRVRVTTIHKSKGLEADKVIILNVNDRMFPFIHPNSYLDEIFDINEDQIIEEEKRLFYVAMTRAKEQIYFLTDFSQKSSFINNIDCTFFEPYFAYDYENKIIYSKNENQDLETEKTLAELLADDFILE